MEQSNIIEYIANVIEHMPSSWLKLTTHRLDIYDEKLAKSQFLDQFDMGYMNDDYTSSFLEALPTAYDYIRLGHPLSCVLEWTVAKSHALKPEYVISFASHTTPILAVLRKNLLSKTMTRIVYVNTLPKNFDADIIRQVYGYEFELVQVESLDALEQYDGCTIYISKVDDLLTLDANEFIDFQVNIYEHLGSIIIAKSPSSIQYISEIQHVRRRETIAMTPSNCLLCLQRMIGKSVPESKSIDVEKSKSSLLASIKEITQAPTKAIVGSSGLSVQYAIMMGLIHDSQVNHPGKAIKFVVPPNCYGGTNDQARRVAACIENVKVVDLHVDGDHDMVQSLDMVLNQIAEEDAIAYIIAEIPTNPRVEVPDLKRLKEVLCKVRYAPSGDAVIDPVFILDQTFCPNVHFLGTGKTLSEMRAISYASGSKFPSGGLCTAGYCVANEKAASLMEKIELHLHLCDNEATNLQYDILAKQLPSMNQRIHDAYLNTRHFVSFIQEVLPSAKINFVSEEIVAQGFTPSVFSLDLPTKGNTPEEKESTKRALNLKLIDMMIKKIPNESKYCVSYGQLKGCYWTIPATSTQGTTKEGDKDYIARVSLSGDMDIELHKKVFMEFVKECI